MPNSFFRKFAYQLAAILIGLSIGLALQFAEAWVSPPASPPQGNVGAPINIGAYSQIKSGALGVSGLLRAYIMTQAGSVKLDGINSCANLGTDANGIVICR
ncbi:MAG: hypothetical protein PHQ47_01220 [Candidatus Portnoybacteria bacterium]|nr:hypothetical protein [Candidatus Portnoybacteria bacterium]